MEPGVHERSNICIDSLDFQYYSHNETANRRLNLIIKYKITHWYNLKYVIIDILLLPDNWDAQIILICNVEAEAP